MVEKKKIFVLDTSVLLHDYQSLTSFADNDVAIPITVLEELDNFKVGNDTKNFSAREVIRFIDKIASSGNLQDWISLGKDLGKLKIILDHNPNGLNAEKIFAVNKNDHRIINAGLVLKESETVKKVVLVTKDINLRIKAKALGLDSADYQTGKVDVEKVDASSFYQIDGIASEVIEELFNTGHIEENGILGKKKIANGYYILKNGKTSTLS